MIDLALAVLAGLSSVAAERVDFSNRPLLAGRASLTEVGYVENRSRNNGSGQRFIASNGDSRHPTAEFRLNVL